MWAAYICTHALVLATRGMHAAIQVVDMLAKKSPGAVLLRKLHDELFLPGHDGPESCFDGLKSGNDLHPVRTTKGQPEKTMGRKWKLG